MLTYEVWDTSANDLVALLRITSLRIAALYAMEDASAAKNLMEILDGLGKSGESESDEETDLVPFLQVHNRYGMAIICMHCLQFTTLSRSKCITLFIGRNFVFVIFAANM